MKRIALLAGVAAVGLQLSTPVHAQLAVFDATLNFTQVQQLARDAEAAAKRLEQINNQIIQIKNLEDTLLAVRHGNLAALGTLAEELGGSSFTSPLGTDSTAVFKSLARLGGDLALTGTVTKGIIAEGQYFAPSGTDARALWINNVAQALAAQRGYAQTSLQSTMAYQQKLVDLRKSLGSTADIKASTDAGVRLQGETTQQVATANQMLALLYQQRVQQQMQEAQDGQRWRCWAELMQKQAQAREDSAKAGQVVLTNGLGGTCASGSSSSSFGTVSGASLTADMTGSVFNVSATGTASGGNASDSRGVLSIMTGQSWGQQAADNATTLGVNPTALAATCVLESNCSSNVGGTGTISGAFQMSNGTYNEAIQNAVSANPDLASQVAGKNDPGSQSVAASQYLLQGAQALQKQGISDPSILDVRSYYQFGPANAASVANAPDNQLMTNVLSGLSSGTLAANNIGSATTVGQWRNTVTNKIGDAASQSVLLGSASAT